jgi:Tol biopolymer transport system component
MRQHARLSVISGGLLILGVLLAALAPVAVAAPPKVKLGSFCTTSGTAGGQCSTPRGAAVNATGAGGVAPGEVYVLDVLNNRVQAFTSAGAFERAFGKGVNETTGGDICTAESGNTCKAGIAGEAAGELNAPWGIAVDQTTGTVYVSEQTSRRVDVFSATGEFEGAIGWGVNASAPAEEVQFCTVVTGCKAGVAGGAAGQLSNLKLSGVAVDPRNGDLYVADLGNLRLAEYSTTTNATGEVTGASFVRTVGTGQFRKEGTNGTPASIAVDSSGNIYAASPKFSGSCSAAEPCSIQKFNPDGTFKEFFGPSSGECQLTFTSGESSLQSAIAVAVDPVEADHDNRVYVIRKAGSAEYRVLEFDEAGTSCTVSPPVGTATLAGAGVLATGLAPGIGGRLYADQGLGEVAILGEAPPAEVEMTMVEDVTANGATFRGSVTPPEASGVTTSWHFEYSTDQSHWTAVPIPDRAVASGSGVPETVEESVSGLLPNTHYFVGLCATTSSTVCSPETEPPLEFTTGAIGPTVIPFSAEVTQAGATLGAEINPNNLATHFHFEWATPSEWALSPGTYGHQGAEGEIPPGSEAVIVHEQLSGLTGVSLYHFRVVASSSAGPTTSPDQGVETLDACGMTDGRCLELVSRADKGPLANPGQKAIGGSNMQFQALPQGSELAYTVEGGYPDATSGDESLYLATRGELGWESEQISPPASEPSANISSGLAGAVKVLSANLGCAVVASPVMLTPDAPRGVRELGGANLYLRDNSTGAYEVITNLPPLELLELAPALSAGEYQVIGTSPDCQRVIFRTEYRYPGLPRVDSQGQLYEWNQGTLRSVAIIPAAGGETEPVPAESIPGAIGVRAGAGPLSKESTTDFWHAVSSDGSKSVFTAVSRFGGDVGKPAIFLRDTDEPGVSDGSKPAIDISQSETVVANDGYSRYQSASTDGRRIFFTARYGLATNGSSSGATSCSDLPGTGKGDGCDLYEYDVAAPVGERLTDLSPDTSDPTGAGVPGVLDTSADGTSVYFAARGRLGGAGRTEAENLRADAYNVYLYRAGDVRLVGSVGESEVLNLEGTGGQALVLNGSGRGWTSRSTDDGGMFAFESSVGVPDGARMVYLYSAATDSTVCVSCRHDGLPPGTTGVHAALISGANTNTADQTERPVTLTPNGRLYFYSVDPLATGAVEGTRNLYQWEHGQVSLVATEPVETPSVNEGRTRTANFFAGASADGGDVFFATNARLLPGDPDERWDVYDARVGGGFPEPPAPPAPCDAGVEGGCNSGQANAPAQVTPSTPSFVGPGNPPVKKHKHRRHKRKHHRKKHHHKKSKARHANAGRKAAK